MKRKKVYVLIGGMIILGLVFGLFFSHQNLGKYLKVMESTMKVQQKGTNSRSNPGKETSQKTEQDKRKIAAFNQGAVDNNFYIEHKDRQGRPALEKATEEKLETIEKTSPDTVISQRIYEGKPVSVIETKK